MVDEIWVVFVTVDGKENYLKTSLPYSTPDNETRSISRVLIGQHWLFAEWRHHRAVTCLENVRQSNIRTGKKLGVQLSHKHPPVVKYYNILSLLSVVLTIAIIFWN